MLSRVLLGITSPVEGVIANEGVGADHCVPVLQALLDAIGQTRRFIVKVSEHNLTEKIHAIIVTKILPPATATSDDALNTGGDDSGPS
ncbi:unnamed protein product [Eruca vesicaria subsp. sativa]|uniref:Uncharacterized protein n=1 Tax=Eruca vesicaria subsp. sativa TaxID=29727 RepID=A0ABC8JCS4_ERUVS|nr:unnamed protein product [Eruca vesicaria subsp. sativa]